MYMKLVLKQKIRHGAFVIAVSPDETKVAISSELQVSVFALLDFQKIVTFRVPHVCSMSFQADNIGLSLFNTIGEHFEWNGETVQKTPCGPVDYWAETPVFYSGSEYAFWTFKGNIYRYNLIQKSIKSIYTSEKELKLCGCKQGLLTVIGFQPGEQKQKLEVISVDFDGSVVVSRLTNEPVPMFYLGRPCCTADNLIAVSTLCKQYDTDYHRTLYALLLINSITGEIILQKSEPRQKWAGDCYSGRGIISEVVDKSVVLFSSQEPTLKYEIDKTILDPAGKINPPTEVTFLSDGRILVGSWSNLFVFSI